MPADDPISPPVVCRPPITLPPEQQDVTAGLLSDDPESFTPSSPPTNALPVTVPNERHLVIVPARGRPALQRNRPH